jgi:hypothetical protein
VVVVVEEEKVVVASRDRGELQGAESNKVQLCSC